MTLPWCPGIVRVLSPVTLSLEVHWEDVSELSVAATQHRDKELLVQQYWVRHHTSSVISTEPRGQGSLGWSAAAE